MIIAAAGALRRLAARAGRRGAFLAFLAVLDFGYGYSLIAATARERVLDLLLPWPAWGSIWLAVGALCAAGIFARFDRLSFTAAAALKFCWAGLFAWVWEAQHYPRGWVAVIIWLGFGAVVLIVSGWPEPPLRTEMPAP